MSDQEYDLVGIGNAIVDVLSQTEDSFIQEQHLDKGNMTLIEADQAEALYANMGPGLEVSGGSVANSVAAFSSLGGNAGFIGKVAQDQLGDVFTHDIRATGVTFNTQPLQDGAPTARCLILVTPDADRTMCTFLGASVWLASSDIDPALIENAKVTYLEGYLFDRDMAKQAFRRAAELAHGADKKVALSLSDAFCVDRHRNEFLDLVENHIDILFANEDEIMSLYQVDTFEEAADAVIGHCEVAVLTRGAKGSVIISENERHEISSEPVERVVDTTGAGDLYAAGFLYGYTRDLPLGDCGRIASITASEVITHMGARPQVNLSRLVEDKLGKAA